MDVKLINYKDKILSTKSEVVSYEEFGKQLDELMSDMLVLMHNKQGVGLAGNQIGISKQILVADLGYVNNEDYGSNTIKIVNPKIISSSIEEISAEEGCLSFPGLVKKVSRPVAIRIKYQDPFGVEQDRVFKDWQARIILHEMDHLDGITLYSRASRMLKSRYDKKQVN